MPRFEPFAGLRYDSSIPLDLVVAPPYDVVGPAERAELAGRHPANSILVELPEEADGLDRYEVAARLLKEWAGRSVLRRDPQPVFYAYRMTPLEGGRPTTGVIGALGCEPPGGDVLPHEETTPKDTRDRLDLLRACRANLSPIWGLSLTKELSRTFEPSGPPNAEAVQDGVLHQLWVIDDPVVHKAISQAVEASAVVIADGHHRYQTALDYRDEHETPGGPDLVMALIVELSTDQLVVKPIHRTLSGFDEEIDILEVVGERFETVFAGPLDEPTAAGVIDSGALALAVPKGIWVLTPRSETIDEAGTDIDSATVALSIGDIDGAAPTYHHDWKEALSMVQEKKAQAATFLRPVTVEQIAGWARDRRRMPPKSTYFVPKPRTGMVFRPLD